MKNKKIIIAHRGARFYEKENTILAFKKAVQLKADMIEFDVRKTKDNKIIIFHDEEIDKILVKTMDYSELIRKLGYEVPTLEKTLKFLKGKIKLDIHLKEEGYEKEAIKLILEYFSKKEIMISSEFPSSLKKIKINYPEIKTGLVIQVKYRNYIQVPFGFFPMKKIINSNADYIIPPWQIVNKIFLMRSNKLNKKIFPWTINNKKLAGKLLKNEIVAGIITDIPDLMSEK